MSKALTITSNKKVATLIKKLKDRIGNDLWEKADAAGIYDCDFTNISVPGVVILEGVLGQDNHTSECNDFFELGMEFYKAVAGLKPSNTADRLKLYSVMDRENEEITYIGTYMELDPLLTALTTGAATYEEELKSRIEGQTGPSL